MERRFAGRFLQIHIGFACLVSIVVPDSARALPNLWTSADELRSVPKSGSAWTELLNAANADCSHPDVSNPKDDTNVNVLAAGIVFARTGQAKYKNKVVAACESLVVHGNPGGSGLAWARETGAYALAADLVGYRTAGFEAWLGSMAERYRASEGFTLLELFRRKPNNWGSHAFGSLCAIYGYLDDLTRLSNVRKYWLQGLKGQNPEFRYGGDRSWHADAKNPRLINPRGAVRQGLDIGGAIPDEMRRGGPFHIPPLHTNYPWEFMQGQIMAARILERTGLPLWAEADSALNRAAFCLQDRFEKNFGGWAAERDDIWMLPFLDEAYGTSWSQARRSERRLWGAGKNAGWPYVTLAPRTDTFRVEASQDAWVQGGRDANRNFDSSSKLHVVDLPGTANDAHAFLQFPLAGPSGSVIRAEVELYCKALPKGPTASASIFAVTEDAWTERTLTWNNAPQVGRRLDSRSDLDTQGRAYVFDVTSFVAASLPAKHTLSFALLDDRGTGLPIDFGRREGQHGPTLTIVTKRATRFDAVLRAEPSSARGEPVKEGATMSFFLAEPNPFNPSTLLSYGLRQAGRVRLRVYDVRGRLVSTLVDQTQSAGLHQQVWWGNDGSGRSLSGGAYLVWLEAPDFERHLKLVLVR